MITPNEAEKLTENIIVNYVRQYECETEVEVANAVMKLAGMCGLAMCKVVGKWDAVQRMASVLRNTENASLEYIEVDGKETIAVSSNVNLFKSIL